MQHFSIGTALTTLVLVKVMKVNFPFLLSVHQVAEELFIIQQAIFVFVIRVNDGLGGDRHLFNQQVCCESQHINE